jgi:acyl-coenzyme A thioesterase PaaI-like protein
MDRFNKMLETARKSRLRLFLLNLALQHKIPFNKPHGLKIAEITPDGFTLVYPYKRKNLNHLKGLHACGLATLCEYAAGLTMMRKVGIENYRLILESIHVKYSYQGKSDGICTFELKDEFIREHVVSPLQSTDMVFVELNTEVSDIAGNIICSGTTRWQIKKWDKVRTRT